MKRLLITIGSVGAGLLAMVALLHAAASYPSSVKTFATRTNGQTISQSWFNDLQDEVHAIEDGLLNGVAHALKPSSDGGQDLGTSGLHWGTAYINTISGSPTITSPTLSTSIISPLVIGCGIRLTLTSGTPVTTGDVTGATTIYATPYSTGGWGAGTCAFYDGSSAWTLLTFTETSIALGTLTSGRPYDVFCYNNSGTMACEVLAWTNGTTRATALVLQNGVLAESGATTRRYIGTFYTTSTTATEDSLLKRYLWNYYNRRPRQLQLAVAAGTYNYTTATVRQFGGSATNQVAAVVGVAEDPIQLAVINNAYSAGAAAIVQIGIGADVTNAFSTGNWGGLTDITSSGSTAALQLYATYQAIPAVGAHVYAACEWSNASGGTTTWNSATGATSPVPNGIQGWIHG